jgi:hypothetical protein
MSLWILILLALAAAAIVGLVTFGLTRAKAAPPRPKPSGAELPPRGRSVTHGSESAPAPVRETPERPRRLEPMAPDEPQEPIDVAHGDLPSPSCDPSPAPLPDPGDDWGRGPRPLSVEVEADPDPKREEARDEVGEPTIRYWFEPRSVPASVSWGPSPTPRSVETSFSAYHPRQVAPGVWFRLHAYVARAGTEDLVEADLERVAERPEDLRELVKRVIRPIAEGAAIAVAPRAEGIEFNPPEIRLSFLREVHRFDFGGRAEAAKAGAAAVGEITFSVAGVLVAAIPLVLDVATGEPAGMRFERAQYRKIFPSYSHRDTHVVRSIERAHRSLGDTVLRDALALRSGERWSPRLLELIEEADLFQLFWSPAAAASRYVADEWGHALGLIGRGQKPERFVRPVYWQQPLTPPPLPEALAALHFHFDPELDDRAAAPPEAP